MKHHADVNAIKVKSICRKCVGEKFLSAEILASGKRRKCSYCKNTNKSYSIEKLSERIETAFTYHYSRTSDQPTALQNLMISDDESTYEFERDGEQTTYAIMNAADIPENAAIDVQIILEDKYSDFESDKLNIETEFSSDAYYTKKGTRDDEWCEGWQSFENSLKSEARFFNLEATTHLTNVFNEIETKSTGDKQPLILGVGPGTNIDSVFRARVFQSEIKLKTALAYPDQHLGPPPGPLARAGRMNAHGISVFYGATDSNTALAETRPPVGSRVLVAQFEIIRPLRLLDLTALGGVQSTGSIFDPEYIRRLEHEMFLRSLSERITRPVMPDDEALEYLATQAVADFLSTGRRTTFDGIIYPSVQVAKTGKNIVLFNKSARIEQTAKQNGAEISVRLGYFDEDGFVTDYAVTETTPHQYIEHSTRHDNNELPSKILSEENNNSSLNHTDNRKPALRIIIDSINVHEIKCVSFETNKNSVLRHTNTIQKVLAF